MVREEWYLKAHPAYRAASLTDYLLIKELDKWAGNPPVSTKRNGLLLINPSGTEQKTYFNLPEKWQKDDPSPYSAGIPTELDREQITGSCRDWISTDSYVSMHNEDKGL
jgi:hypothetical protein